MKGIKVILFLLDRPLRRNARQAVDLSSSTELWYLGFECWEKTRTSYYIISRSIPFKDVKPNFWVSGLFSFSTRLVRKAGKAMASFALGI